MRHWSWAGGLTALALICLASAALRAGAASPSAVECLAHRRRRGVKPNIFVPYTTNGVSTLGIANGVAPRIYLSPSVDNPQDPQTKPVFNLPFYGAVQGFGDRSNGAVPRPPGPPLGARQR